MRFPLQRHARANRAGLYQLVSGIDPELVCDGWFAVASVQLPSAAVNLPSRHKVPSGTKRYAPLSRDVTRAKSRSRYVRRIESSSARSFTNRRTQSIDEPICMNLKGKRISLSATLQDMAFIYVSHGFAHPFYCRTSHMYGFSRFVSFVVRREPR